ncbi:uncharacterized protein BJ171DRAFT_498364 [Polychytrium aggregatum]|uniref:uncharacterized protein n=1 Tax=Polychytrium aggregatum TaxID=110093 RepID=UPI0022FE25BA|nr:uncharacterized protein BJ171DRAFT_498364 [Polychytrium aggregatum]KAI9205997.1 hypothetical protein BJ171DRAFT_498364 [Polychytrium aggregatum]
MLHSWKQRKESDTSFNEHYHIAQWDYADHQWVRRPGAAFTVADLNAFSIRLGTDGSDSVPVDLAGDGDDISVDGDCASSAPVDIPADLHGDLVEFVFDNFDVQERDQIRVDAAKIYRNPVNPFLYIPLSHRLCFFKLDQHKRSSNTQYIRFDAEGAARMCWDVDSCKGKRYKPVKLTKVPKVLRDFLKSQLSQKNLKRKFSAATASETSTLAKKVVAPLQTSSSVPVYMEDVVVIDHSLLTAAGDKLKPIFQGFVGAHFQTIRDIRFQHSSLLFNASFGACPDQDCREPFASPKVAGVKYSDGSVTIRSFDDGDGVAACHSPVAVALKPEHRTTVDAWIRASINEDDQLSGIVQRVASHEVIAEEIITLIDENFGKPRETIHNPRLSPSGAHADISSSCRHCGGTTRADIEGGGISGVYALALIREQCETCQKFNPPYPIVAQSKNMMLGAALDKVRQRFPDRTAFAGMGFSLQLQNNGLVNFNNITITSPADDDGIDLRIGERYLSDDLVVFTDANINAAFIQALGCKPKYVAEFLYSIMSDDIYVRDCKSPEAFTFAFPKWRSNTIEIFILNVTPDRNSVFNKAFMRAIDFYENSPHLEHAPFMATKLQKYINKVGDGVQNTPLQRMIASLFSQKFDEFWDKLDHSTTTVLFEDGTILDLISGATHKATKHDMFSTSLKLPYNAAAIHNAEKKQEVYKYLLDLQNQDADVVEYLLLYFSLCLSCAKNGEMALFVIGDGENGKSLLLELLQNTFGREFCCAFNADILTEKPKSTNEVTHQFIGLLRARCAIANEIQDGETLQEKVLKQITSNDVLQIREMYHHSASWVPRFKAIISLNSFPQISGATRSGGGAHGTLRRIVVVEFPMKIVKKNPEVDQIFPFELPVDPEIVNKVNSTAWRYALLGLLIERFPKASDPRNKLSSPSSWPLAITLATEHYTQSLDIVKVFLESQYEIDITGRKGMIEKTILYRHFVAWVHSKFAELYPKVADKIALKHIDNLASRSQSIAEHKELGKICAPFFSTSTFFRPFDKFNAKSKTKAYIEGLVPRKVDQQADIPME